MKHVFTHGHSTTQRSESTNAHIKGQGDLSDVLADATLVQTHLIIDRMSRETHRNAVEELIRLRRANKRVSQYYEDHCEHSIRLAGLNVISSTDEGNGKYSVTDVSGNVTEVTVSGKIVHQGNVYIIMSCN